MTETLRAISFPLWGSRLIEASAGTGKTWTIAALYLRLVLGHGAENGFARPLVPSEILVMTFTRAATRELSDRIRSRLLDAARCFRGEASPPPSDTLLIDLLDAYPQGAARSAAAWRLALAAESMDDAAVHTIDAWCQRMLREHAFDSGCLFDEELNANERAIQVEAAQDYWRQQLYPLAGTALDLALGVWPGVEALSQDARELLNQPMPGDAGEGRLGQVIERLVALRRNALAELKAGWGERARAMQVWIDAQMDAKQCPFSGVKLGRRFYSVWLSDLATWADDAPAEVDQLDLKTGATRLTPAGMAEALNGKFPAPELPGHFAAFERLMGALAELPSITAGVRAHAAVSIAQRLAELKAQAGSFGFADMLTRLDGALAPAQGEAAERLRARMLAQYPVALIDEFQDTSPVQSRIFDRLYRVADNDRASALLLIGDPKQSIYGFRGADIYSYLLLRRATQGRHYVLGTNHRSTGALVAAVNHLFDHAEARAGEPAAEGSAAGAFMFRSAAQGPPANPLPFVPVEARGRAETFVTSTGPSPALSFTLDAELRDARSSRRLFAARCAQRIVSLLNDAAAGFAHADAADRVDTFARLRPADIAVLVRTGVEAAAVRRELRRRNVASVYLSDQVSVFASDEARDLLRWLKAVAAPLDMRLARAALATRTVGLSIAELARLASDDEAFDARSEQLRQLHSVWRNHGVLTMLRQSLHRLDLPARWLGGPQGADEGDDADGADEVDDGGGNEMGSDRDGERRLTNFLHLAELLQSASTQLDGEQALIRWLSLQMQADAGGGDEQIVRLESDADLVQVVTVHKAKGLEYPLVFVPFATSFRPVDKARTPFVSAVDAAGQRTLHLEPSSAQIAQADIERQREDLRLLYVAVTRARHALWVGVAALKIGQGRDCVFHRSALGHLLLGRATRTAPDALAGQIGRVIEACADITLEVVGAAAKVPRSRLRVRAVPAPLRDAAPYAASFERRWSIGSFSALVRALGSSAGWLPSSVAAARDDEILEPAGAELAGEPVAPAARSASRTVAASAVALASSAETNTAAGRVDLPDPPWHRFPRGAMAGNFLHDQLEWLAGEGFVLDAAQLLRRCERRGWGAHGQDVVDWLARVVATRLPPVGAALGELGGVLAEMEFWLPSAGLASSRIDAACCAHLLGGRERPALPQRELRGMLMGFADLVFEHAGRYWVLDYKSNHLGNADGDYSAEALDGAMARHRYDVQAALYLLALHRQLRERLGAGYDPARQLGGAVYVFLRGLQGPVQGCFHVVAPVALLDELDAALQGPDGAGGA